MGKKDTFKNDVETELNIDLASEDGIEDVLDTVLSNEWVELSNAVAARFGTVVEPDIVEALVDAYEIDIYDSDPEVPVRAIYSTYMREYG